MKSGTILRGCTFLEEGHSAAIETSIQKKTEEVAQEAKKSFYALLSDCESSFHEELNYFKTYKERAQDNFNKQIEDQRIQFNKCIFDLEQEHLKLTNKLQEDFQQHINHTKEDIKEIMITLFEKFFFKEYQNTENLESLIENVLSQLEDSKEIQISLYNTQLEKLKQEKGAFIEKLLNDNIQLTSSSKENLICEFKSNIGNVEINFEKQMKKIKDTLNTF